MKREIIQTSDGSTTIYLPDMDENYHSTHGAIQEAEHVFIEYGLRSMEAKNVDTISIFEMGFGTGLNAFLTKVRSKSNVEYTGIEAFPVNQPEISVLNYVELIGEEYAKDFESIHQADWNKMVQIDELFSLKKVEAKIESFAMLSNHFDLIYFDAFGPRAQAEMWHLEILKKMFDGLKVGGALVTYSARGQLKRDLKSLGFIVESLPGPPGKREMTRAWKEE
ncbi:MAG: tRNA (5-methylaminomethyl-2-thiouridine)(34)-methyltransferase MnmD [Flavobacteriales bacterium]|nr:tRNA (5-methylaminomethyl-2-thiouridine)(34)-methyltransferase MnmD [Flavobacteriales bacterium]